jgi:hypothetical protein
MKFRLVVLLLAVVLAVVGCKAPSSKAIVQPSSSAKKVAPAPVPTATAEASWFWSSSDKEFPLFRAVASIHNPGPKALEGVQVEWVAYDAEDSIVGSYKGTEPIVPAGSAIPYVGGAGAANLSGVPARVDIRIVNPGNFVEATSTAFAVSNIQLKRESKSVYTVKAKVRTGSDELSSDTVFADVILRDASGKIVGGDWWFSQGLPDTLPPGSAFTVEFPLVATSGTAASAEVFATERPAQ